MPGKRQVPLASGYEGYLSSPQGPMPTWISCKSETQVWFSLRSQHHDILMLNSTAIAMLSDGNNGLVLIDHYRDDIAEVVTEPLAEAAHVVGVDLDGGPTLEHRQRVAAEGDVLRVPATGPVRVHDVRVAAHLLQHPWRQRDAANVRATNINQSINQLRVPTTEKSFTLFIQVC